MSLSPAQLATLKTDILANSATLATAIAERDGPVIAAFYNVLAVPDFLVWRTEVPINLILGMPWCRNSMSKSHSRLC